MSNKLLEDKGYLIFPVLFLSVSAIWAMSSNYTWDDDAATRYMYTLNAANNPKVFLDSWVRPLFSVIFYLPIHFLGRAGLVLMMSLMTATSGVLLYKGLRHKGYDNAYAVVFFLLFQTFVFGISRDAMTEPLASFIFSLGLYFYFTDRLAWFAVAGSLLPLARTETVLLLPFWAFVLLQRKKYFFIPLLGTGILLWIMSWALYAGDFMAFFKEVFKSSEAPNRYARTSITHHFGKLVYVLGPAVYLFFLLGYVTSIRKFISDYFIFLQFTAGFVMYGYFSSANVSLGQSGGALRNLITLSPLAAVIALYGFNYWISIFRKKEENIPVPAETLSKKQQKKKPVANKKDDVWMKKAILAVFVLLLMLLAARLLSAKLLLRQNFSEDETDYTILAFLGGCCLLVLLSIVEVIKKPFIFIFLLFALQVGFTLYFESPDSHSNEERVALNDALAWIRKADMEKNRIYCNNAWLFWAAGGNQADTVKYGGIDSSSIRRIKTGEVVVWEPHYTGKNYTNIPQTVFLNDTTMQLVSIIRDKDNGSRALIFVKEPSKEKAIQIFNDLEKKFGSEKMFMYLKGNFERSVVKDLNLSNKSLSRSIELDPSFSDPYYLRGVNYLIMNKPDSGCRDLRTANSLGNKESSGVISQYCAGR
jgi:hypothetical protein